MRQRRNPAVRQRLTCCYWLAVPIIAEHLFHLATLLAADPLYQSVEITFRFNTDGILIQLAGQTQTQISLGQSKLMTGLITRSGENDLAIGVTNDQARAYRFSGAQPNDENYHPLRAEAMTKVLLAAYHSGADVTMTFVPVKPEELRLFVLGSHPNLDAHLTGGWTWRPIEVVQPLDGVTIPRPEIQT